ncbi:MAG: lipid II flippase MurJ [Patescibacteria group bacterium]
MRLFAFLRSGRIASGVAILALTQFAASLAGLLRDRALTSVFADHFGVVDVYIAAFRPSDLLFQTAIMSAVGTVLVPILASYEAKGDTRGLGKVLNGTVGMAALVFGILALILGIVFPSIAPFLVQFEGEQLELYISFGRLALFTNFLFVFGITFGQYLITVQRYWMYGITPVLYTLGTIFGTYVFTPSIGAYGPMAGTIVGASMYVLIRFLAVHMNGVRFRFSLWHADLKEIGRLMMPRILSLGAFQFQLLFLDRIASGFPEGAVTINAYARNFQSLLVGIVGIAVAQSVYSVLSQAAAKNDARKFILYFRKGEMVTLLLTVPGAIALVLLAPVAAWLVHLSGVLRVFSLCVLIYSFSIPFESLNHLQLRAFYALRDTFIPAIMGISGGLIAIVVATFSARTYGIYGIAAGYTSGIIIQTLGLWALLPRKRNRTLAPISPLAEAEVSA